MATSPAPATMARSILRRLALSILFVNGLKNSSQLVRPVSRISSWPNVGPGLISRTNSLPIATSATSTPVPPLPYYQINKHASLEDLSSFRLAAFYLPVYNDEGDEPPGAAQSSRAPSEFGFEHTGLDVSGESYAIAPGMPAQPLSLALLREPPDFLHIQDVHNGSSTGTAGPSLTARLNSYTQSSSSEFDQAPTMAAVASPVQSASASASRHSLDSAESVSPLNMNTFSVRVPAHGAAASAASSVSSELSDGTADHVHAVGGHEHEPVQLEQEELLMGHILAPGVPLSTEPAPDYASSLSISRPPSPLAVPSTLAGFMGVRPKLGTWPLERSTGIKRRLSGLGQEYLKRVRTEHRHGSDAAMVAS
ncbi:hypothetical protein F503_04958 [Ophiostoma piceae UAMH 11346]|uniref:Uncharacterized protein n=1 Tax=Ophiostoma piceae (strain UAMH 11346) TaxID=1262450 RepID=S3CT60_OPHP1|nr:hypothetical protein F503_04958 [Ophiostoma piceae UAMH 11346]